MVPFSKWCASAIVPRYSFVSRFIILHSSHPFTVLKIPPEPQKVWYLYATWAFDTMDSSLKLHFIIPFMGVTHSILPLKSSVYHLAGIQFKIRVQLCWWKGSWSGLRGNISYSWCLASSCRWVHFHTLHTRPVFDLKAREDNYAGLFYPLRVSTNHVSYEFVEGVWLSFPFFFSGESFLGESIEFVEFICRH